jgi:hypothetical protein
VLWDFYFSARDNRETGDCTGFSIPGGNKKTATPPFDCSNNEAAVFDLSRLLGLRGKDLSLTQNTVYFCAAYRADTLRHTTTGI